jgi:phage regulator Rha-like protein
MALSILTINNDVLVCDSRDIAAELGIEHRALLQTISKYETAIVEHFGAIAFQMRESKTTQGNAYTERYALLTEEQATYTAVLSKNRPEVVKLKAHLVKAFSTARRALRSPFKATVTITQTDTKYTENVFRQYTSSLATRIKSAKDDDELEKLMADGLRFLDDYEKVGLQRSHLQELETALMMNYCFYDKESK